MNSNVPIIETERLRLRGYTLDDLARFTELWSDARFVTPMGAQPNSREEAAGRLMRYVGHWALRGFGSWAVDEKASGRLVGEVGLFDFERDLPPAYAGRPEHGWAIAPEEQGKGYASEAVRASLEWGARHFTPFSPFCIIAEDNAPSLRVADRNGYRETARTLFKGRSTILLQQPAAA